MALTLQDVKDEYLFLFQKEFDKSFILILFDSVKIEVVVLSGSDWSNIGRKKYRVGQCYIKKSIICYNLQLTNSRKRLLEKLHRKMKKGKMDINEMQKLI